MCELQNQFSMLDRFSRLGRLSTWCRCLAQTAWTAGGLLALSTLLAIDVAAGQEKGTTSGLQTSPFELSQPSTGEPPRPRRSLSTPARDLSTNDQPTEAEPVRGSPAQLPAANNNVVQELSVEPGSQPLLPDDAPAWIGALADTTGDVHYLHVGGQIADSEREAAGLLNEALVAAVCDYIDSTVLVGPSVPPGGRESDTTRHRSHFKFMERSGAAEALKNKITPDYIWKNLIDDPQGYVARLNTSGIPMYQKWVTVSITPQQRDMIKDWDREATQKKRLAPVGVGMLGLLGSVGLLHLIFKGRKPRP